MACPPYRSTEAAVDSFVATACAVAVRLEPTDELAVHAPFGFEDLFGLVVRPNPVLAPAAVYEAKARRWAAAWPERTVLPWPSTVAAPAG